MDWLYDGDGSTVGVAPEVRDQDSPGLSPASPNPFRTRTALAFSLTREARVRLTVHDLQGREVARLVDGVRPPGSHVARWDAHRQAAGVYFARLVSGDRPAASVRRLLLVR